MAGPLFVIGVQKEAVKEARASIMDILRCKDAEEKTKRSALITLRELCEVRNTTVTNCVFNADTKRTAK
jgi:hypothetical protein